MNHITIDAGTLTAAQTGRNVTGLLVPFGEECRSDIGRFSFSPGVIRIPEDLTGMSLNIEHQREKVVGAPVAIRETAQGIVATFAIAKTPAGDQALADIRSGKRKRLSSEIANVQIRNGQGVAGDLFASALCEQPAFPSATLLAAAADTEPDAGDEAGGEELHEISEYTDENGVTWRRVVDVETETNGDTTTTTTTVVEEVTDPTNDDPNPDEEEEPMTASTTLAAKAGQKPAPRARTLERPKHDLQTIFASIAAGRTGDQTAMTLLAALTDVKTSGPLGKVGTAGSLPENWMGQIWDGREYGRKYLTLGNHGTDITATGKRGYKARRGTKAAPLEHIDGSWNGDLSAINSGIGYTEELKSILKKFALAEAIAREFVDLPGGGEIVEAFMKLLVEDYAYWSDMEALAAWLKAAGVPIAPRPVPTRYADSPALGQLIQGVLTVERTRDTPTFAIVNQTAYEQLLYTPKDLVPEYVSFEFRTDLTGSADAGKVQVVVADDDQFKNAAGVPLVEEGTPATLVGAGSAIDFDELGSTPLTVDALEIARGGIDRAIHGYLQIFEKRAESVALIGTAHTP